METIEYSVCRDCLMYVAYGHENETMQAHIARTGGHFVPDGHSDNEFSWRPCELCGSTLGGSRHGVSLLIPAPAEARA